MTWLTTMPIVPWHGAPVVTLPPGLDAFWYRCWRTVLRYSPIVNLCNIFGSVCCTRWENVVNASFTVHVDLIKHQRFIWGSAHTRFGVGPPTSLIGPCQLRENIVCVRVSLPDLQAEAGGACYQRKTHPSGNLVSVYCQTGLFIPGKPIYE